MPVWACFSYSADVPLNVTSRGAAQRAPRGPGRMPGYPCFAYPSDTPQAVSSVQPAQNAVSLLQLSVYVFQLPR